MHQDAHTGYSGRDACHRVIVSPELRRFTTGAEPSCYADSSALVSCLPPPHPFKYPLVEKANLVTRIKTIVFALIVAALASLPLISSVAACSGIGEHGSCP